LRRRDLILEQFESETAAQLIEFGNSLPDIGADAYVFMARKSLCLYDMLQFLGCPPLAPPVMSDRVLDLDLDYFRDKHVALIDDSLISGTSLAEAKRLLERQPGIRVTTHVFCADEEWWSRELIRPDSISMITPDAGVRAFCAAEIQALSLVPRPYVADFPISRSFRLSVQAMDSLGTNLGWVSGRVSTSSQEAHGVTSISFLPDPSSADVLEEQFGSHLMRSIEIMKVRLFASRDEQGWRTVLVPMVTLSPLSVEATVQLTDLLATALHGTLGTDFSGLRSSLISPTSQHRFAQHVLSLAIGQLFARQLADITSQPTVEFDASETCRHFGVWNESIISDVYSMDLVSSLRSLESGLVKWEGPSSPPLKLGLRCRKALAQIPSQPGAGGASLLEDAMSVFRFLYENWEKPARQEVLDLGPEILDADEITAPHKDRLRYGVPWGALARRLVQRLDPRDIKPLSFMLDVLNDLGIAVPITVEYDGVVLRAYRHGEDVLFGESEYLLAYEMIRGCLKRWQRESIPHIQLEKLMVALVTIGASRGFLHSLHYEEELGPGVASVTCHLMGVVVRVRDELGSDSPWLSQLLVRRGVICAADDGYVLADEVEASFPRRSNRTDAYELGVVFGSLFPSPAHPNAPLKQGSLIVLLSCATPRLAALAVGTDMILAGDAFRSLPRTSNLDWTSVDSLKTTDRLLRRVLIALGNAGPLKAAGFFGGRVGRVIGECRDYLDSNGDELLSLRFAEYWTALDETQRTDQHQRFDSAIRRQAEHCWNSIALACLMRISIESARLSLRGNDHNRRLRLTRIRKVLEEQATGLGSIRDLTQPKIAASVRRRLAAQQDDGWPAFSHEAVYEYAYARLQRELRTAAEPASWLVRDAEQYGLIESKRSFDEFLYYDVRDSKAVIAASAGRDVVEEERTLREFRARTSRSLLEHTRVAEDADEFLHVWRGPIESHDDQKHIFAQGPNCGQRTKDILDDLVDAADSTGRQLVVLKGPCHLGIGAAASTYAPRSEVFGDLFLEILSQVTAQFKAWASEYPDKTVLADFVPSGHVVAPEDNERIAVAQHGGATYNLRFLMSIV